MKKRNDFTVLVVHLRDLMRLVEEDLKYAMERNIMSLEEGKVFWEPVFVIRKNLDALPDERRKLVDDIIERCDKTIQLLKQLPTSSGIMSNSE